MIFQQTWSMKPGWTHSIYEVELTPKTNQQIITYCSFLNIKKPDISKSVLCSLVLPKTLVLRSNIKPEWLEEAGCESPPCLRRP